MTHRKEDARRRKKTRHEAKRKAHRRRAQMRAGKGA